MDTMDSNEFDISNNINIIHQADLNNAFEMIENLIKNNVLGDEILLIFDLDGTLTDKPEPALGIPVQARENALAFAQFAKTHGVNTFISSAWDIFAETLYRIDKLGLSELFLTTKANYLRKEIDDFIDTGADKKAFKSMFSNVVLKSDSILSEHLDLSKTIIGSADDQYSFITINYCHLGNVVSVRDSDLGNFTPQFYRNKALSPLVACPDLDYKKIKHVIFVEDSRHNINYFVSDIQRLWKMGVMNFDPDVKIEVFELKIAG